MKGITRRRPSPALIVAMVALIAATSGAAIALPGKNSVKSNDIAKDAVRTKHIKEKNVETKQIDGKAVTGAKLAKDSVKSSKVIDGALSSEELGDYNLLGSSPVKLAPTSAATADAARTAAPETALLAADSIEVYAKCLYDTGTGTIRGEMYVRTSADGAMMEGTDDLPGISDGTEFLNVGTAEVDRQLDTQTSTMADTASFNESEVLVTSATGRALSGLTSIGVKQGSPAGGNGPFGAGDVCLFGGAMFG